jgi:hypothetical protein
MEKTASLKIKWGPGPGMQIISHRELEKVIRVLHRNCDPADMTYEDHLVWEEWNKRFHPENYDEANESEGNGAV